MGLTSWKEYRLRNRKSEGESTESQDVNTDLPVQRLNEVTKEELLSIKGIGPKTAAAILRNVPYDDLDGVDAIKGVSKKAAKFLREWIISEI